MDWTARAVMLASQDNTPAFEPASPPSATTSSGFAAGPPPPTYQIDMTSASAPGAGTSSSSSKTNTATTKKRKKKDPPAGQSGANAKKTKKTKRKGKNTPTNGRIRVPVKSACVNCRRSKVACDEYRPCARCMKRGVADTCYDPPHKKRGRKKYVTLLCVICSYSSVVMSCLAFFCCFVVLFVFPCC
jgi:Fungal Zn(2)-Cys(6) binuclear cluster domain